MPFNSSRSLSRFIPARAGNGDPGRWGRGSHPVHPRACGERSIIARTPKHDPGSSPRVRGTGLLPMRSRRLHRFIPARAGNGANISRIKHAGSVHPRACGERSCGSISSHSWNGSSPRVRGTVLHHHGHDDRSRFIPARAGNGPINQFRPSWTPVHPRACGERLKISAGSHDSTGSSPRVRGTAPACLLGHHNVRFIPARAGNGSIAPSTQRATTVHPRACGERADSSCRRRTNHGSSPRVRGTVVLPQS